MIRTTAGMFALHDRRHQAHRQSNFASANWSRYVATETITRAVERKAKEFLAHVARRCHVWTALRHQATAGAPAGFKGRRQKAIRKKLKAENRGRRSEGAEFIPLRRPTALGAGAYSHAAKHSDVEAE
jgi:hypothetical protein